MSEKDTSGENASKCAEVGLATDRRQEPCTGTSVSLPALAQGQSLQHRASEHHRSFTVSIRKDNITHIKEKEGISPIQYCFKFGGYFPDK